jgi:hypothetical protein
MPKVLLLSRSCPHLWQQEAQTVQVLDGLHSLPPGGETIGISTVASGITQEQFLIPAVQRGCQGIGNEGTFCETFHK